MSTGSVASSLASALLGAVTGGLISGRVSRRTLAESAALERAAREREERQRVARELASAITRVLVDVPSSGSSAAYDTSLADLRVSVAGGLPVVSILGLGARLEQAVDMLARNPGYVAEVAGLTPEEQRGLTQRNAADRRSYCEWVVGCLQTVASGGDAPGDRRPPARLDDIGAPYWS